MSYNRLDESEKSIVIEITRSAALVLDALLARWDTEDMPATLRLEYPAEWSALWAIEAGLESQLKDLVSPDYPSRLDEARHKVGTNAGPRVENRSRVAARRCDLGQLLRRIANSVRGR